MDEGLKSLFALYKGTRWSEINISEDELSVAKSEVYAVPHLFPVHLKFPATSGEERQMDVWRYIRVPLCIESSCYLVVVSTHLLTEVT